MNTFKRWNRKSFEDWGSVMSDDAKSFYKAFKNYLKREFPESELIGFEPNHYDFSGFLKFGDKYIYISHALDRGTGKIDFNASDAMGGVLYRTAKDSKDYTGGANHFASIRKLADGIRDLLGKMEKEEVAVENNMVEAQSKWLKVSKNILNQSNDLYSYQSQLKGAASDNEIQQMVFNSLKAASKLMNFAYSALLDEDDSFMTPEIKDALMKAVVAAGKIKILESQESCLDSLVEQVLAGKSVREVLSK